MDEHKTIAAVESRISYICYAVGNGNGSKFGAACKGRLIYIFYAIGYGNANKAGAIERVSPYTCHAGGNCN